MTALQPLSEPTAPQTAAAFERLAGPLRRELKLHCYRMLGSLHEAEDLVQETYLRAWRHFGQFEGRGAFRGWLYQIATNACLNALARRRRKARLLPYQLGPATSEMPDPAHPGDVAWLEPYPDADLEDLADPAPGPEARLGSRQAVQLAFVAVIQELPPRQRAVLLLCDVLGWSAAETATLLGGSTASVNSALQRARATLAQRRGATTSSPATPDAAQSALLQRYLAAWERLDVDALAALLKADATYTMPPRAEWYVGRAAIRAFFAWAWPAYFDFRLVQTAANGQPAFAAYSRTDAQAPWTAHSLHVLSLEGEAISEITLFTKPVAPRLFAAFGLPLEILHADEASGRTPAYTPADRRPGGAGRR
ncbi:MAG TPA: RNA polymerase subunit sigma-70 [Phenylobacterium sp.]|nr:RNA polymerase subunit sigma-70 [Phenylobacterium sp.]